MDTATGELIAELEQDTADRRPTVDRLAREGDVDVLVAALSLAPRPLTRQLICDILGRVGDPASLDALVQALDDENHRVRASAADAIGKMFGYTDNPPTARRPAVLEALLRRWGREDSDAVRSTLVQTLALLGTQSVKPVLEEALASDDSRVRGQARWGLNYLDELPGSRDD